VFNIVNDFHITAMLISERIKTIKSGNSTCWLQVFYQVSQFCKSQTFLTFLCLGIFMYPPKTSSDGSASSCTTNICQWHWIAMRFLILISIIVLWTKKSEADRMALHNWHFHT
jgi:hypothetical protein